MKLNRTKTNTHHSTAVPSTPARPNQMEEKNSRGNASPNTEPQFPVDVRVIYEAGRSDRANTEPQFPADIRGVSLTQDAWRRLKKNRFAMGGLIIVVLYAIVSLLAPILPIHSYTYQVPEHQFLPPSLFKPAGELWHEREATYVTLLAEKEERDPTAAERANLADIKQRIAGEIQEIDGKNVMVHERWYPLGTDSLGRDMLARIIYGGQVSIAIGLIGAITSVLIGIVVGAIAGYSGGTLDYCITRFIDIMYGLPYMLLVIILMSIYGRNIFNLFIALSLISWLTVARVVRGQIISLKNASFVEASRSVGASRARIIFRHLVPNTIGVIIVFASLRVPTFILLEAFLSFLGLGISAPFASWGSLLRNATEGMSLFPWRLFYPALAMSLFLLAMNFLGDGLRDAFDPQSKNQL